MGLYQIQLLIPNCQWHQKYIIDKNANYSAIFNRLDFIKNRFCRIYVYDELDATHEDVCFSYDMVTHSVF